MFEAAPTLFQRVPRGLFRPLGDDNAELYWAVLARLYAHEFEREPFVVLRAVGLEIAEREILESPLWRDRRAELERIAREDDPEQARTGGAAADGREAKDEPELVRALARRVIARLEKTGWIHFQYRSGMGDVLSFPPYAARILEMLLRVARDEAPPLQGYIHSIASLLDPKAFAQRPGVSLAEAKRHTLDLVRELKILERNIHLFTQRLLDEAATAARVLEEGFDRYENAVMSNYHRLKTVENVYRQRSAILDRLAAIDRDELALGAAVDWYAAQTGRSREQAAGDVRADLELLRAQFEAIPRLVEEVDIRNARFSHATLRKLRYLLRQDRRTEGELEFLIDALARGETPDLELDVFSCELLGSEFLYTPPKERAKAERQPFRKPPQADDGTRRRVAAALERAFSRRKVETFVESFLAGREAASLDEVPVESDEDYVRLLYMASYGSADGVASFRLDAEKRARIRKGPYAHPGGRIERRRKSKRIRET